MRRALVEQASYFIVILRPVHTDVTDYDPLALHQRRQYQANNPIDTSSNTLGTGDVIPSHPQPHRLPVETHQRPFSVMFTSRAGAGSTAPLHCPLCIAIP
jgi:hypothetical protein